MSSIDEFLQTARLDGLAWEAVPRAWGDLIAAQSLAVPESIAVLRDLTRMANDQGIAVYPVGGGTQLEWGLPGSRPGIGLSTRSLNAVRDYPARDMTVTVEAGITVSELARHLATENQWLPVDVPFPDQATVGGTVAANVSGPRRFGYGTLRDYVIGIGVVTADGKLARAGGRVVKNVAGYDLCKLYTGSFGTLAVIVELTFRLRPRPESSRFAALQCRRLSAAEQVLANLVHSRTRPVAVELLNRSAAQALPTPVPNALEPEHWLLLVGFEGFAETVEWQLNRLADECAGQADLEYAAVPEQSTTALWQTLTEMRFRAAPLFKAGCRPSELTQLLTLLESSGPLAVQAHAASGITWFWPAEQSAPDAEQIGQWRQWLAERKGHLVVRGATWCRDAAVAPWGIERPDRTLMLGIKQTYDPNDILNPGRFITADGAVQSVQPS